MATKKKQQEVIVRCSAAGVWFGQLKSKKGNEVVLAKARRLWRWWSYFTLSELALHGPHPEHSSDNRYAEALPTITLCDWCEIIPCSAKSVKAIRGIPNANR